MGNCLVAIKSPEKKERIETRFGFVPSSRKKKKKKELQLGKRREGGKKGRKGNIILRRKELILSASERHVS